MGAIWYVGNWLWYVQMGSSRPFNVLRSESEQDDGAVWTPILSLHSPADGFQNLNITSVAYTNLTQSYIVPLDKVVWYEDDDSVTVYPSIPTLSAGSMGYGEVVIRHSPSLSSHKWTRIKLMHPNTTSGVFTAHDLFNYYDFLPGHYVTIRYTPLQFFQVFRPNSTTSTLDRFKSFLGLMGHESDFSYQSTVEHISFPEGVYNNLTSVVILRPQSFIEVISYQEEKSSFKDTMSQIGGLISIVSSILVFLFGVSLMSPWGFIAGIPFFRRRITNSLAKSFNSPEGFSKGPFTTNVKEIGVFDPHVPTTDMRITLLKERVDELELVLSEYYLDGEVFQFYAEERDKVRLERGLTRVGRNNFGKEIGSREGLPDGAYFGRVRHHQRQHSEPSVTEYYQQQQQQQQRQQRQHKQHRHLSDQSLLRRVSDDEETSPAYQLEGLLHQDHHAMHQSYLQQQSPLQSPTSLSGYPSNRNSAPPMASRGTYPPMIPSPFTSDSPVLRDRPGEVNLWESGNTTNNASPTSATTIHPIFSTSTTSAATPTLGTAGGTDSITVAVSTHEHLDMSDLSHIPRQP
ncbi:hypothetical protein BG011_005422 [Mortierella polycephala]|uniref:Uncharacterized protein n=1 Tax=Mortierella polycephala TaxID=41804 RepID=A0A9P6U0C4_9FUNG|nr:hypothetical protein BG011_005422 [Mortierella polycephala]